MLFRPFRSNGCKGPKFAARSEFGLFASYFSQLGVHSKDDYLVISFEHVIKATDKTEVKRVREYIRICVGTCDVPAEDDS